MWSIKFTSQKTEDRSQKQRLRRGYTLAESLVATVVLAVAVGGIIAPISAAYQQTRTVKQSSIAISLAQQLLDEIVSRPFTDPTDLSTTPGPESDEPNRAYFDNVDDYHGYHDSTDPTAADFIRTSSGQSLAWNSTDIYRRSVQVEYRAAPSGPATVAGDYALVKVTVTMPSGSQLSVQRLVCNFPRGS